MVVFSYYHCYMYVSSFTSSTRMSISKIPLGFSTMIKKKNVLDQFYMYMIVV